MRIKTIVNACCLGAALLLLPAVARSVDRPPDCGSAVASPEVIEPSKNHEFVAVSIVGVTDPEGDPVTITITGITQDEPLQGKGSGKTCPDGSGVGTDTAHVRAERDKQGDGRVYQVSFSATDLSGGSCTGTVSVCVPHDDKDPVCVDSGLVVDSTGPCS